MTTKNTENAEQTAQTLEDKVLSIFGIWKTLDAGKTIALHGFELKSNVATFAYEVWQGAECLVTVHSLEDAMAALISMAGDIVDEQAKK